MKLITLLFFAKDVQYFRQFFCRVPYWVEIGIYKGFLWKDETNNANREGESELNSKLPVLSINKVSFPLIF